MRLRALREFFDRVMGRRNPDDFIYGTDIPIVPGKLDELAEARILKEVDDEIAKARAQGLFDTPEYAAYSKRADKTIDKILNQYQTKTGPFQRSGIRSILDPRTDADMMKLLKVAGPVVGAGAVGTYDATEGFTQPYSADNMMMLNPEQIGRAAARVKKTLNEALNDARQAVGDATQVPQAYFMKVQQGYEDEMSRQEEPEELPPTIEEQAIQPVSLLFAEGGPADSGRTMSDSDFLQQFLQNAREFVGESGKTISNRDRMMMRDMLGRTMSDNEPRFETRSPEGQMFSIDANINNLMKSYNMLVDAKEFGRAQEVADQIDQLQQQKIAIQAQNVPMMQSGPSMNLREVMGESGKTISNRDRQIVENILQDISL